MFTSVSGGSDDQSSVPPGLVTSVTKHDVLLGRGSRSNSHPGNQFFRKLIEEWLAEYAVADTDRHGKTRIAQAVVDAVHDRGGRFLQEAEDATVAVSASAASHKGNSDKRKRKRASQCNNDDSSMGRLQRSRPSESAPSRSAPASFPGLRNHPSLVGMVASPPQHDCAGIDCDQPVAAAQPAGTADQQAVSSLPSTPRQQDDATGKSGNRSNKGTNTNPVQTKQYFHRNSSKPIVFAVVTDSAMLLLKTKQAFRHLVRTERMETGQGPQKQGSNGNGHQASNGEDGRGCSAAAASGGVGSPTAPSDREITTSNDHSRRRHRSSVALTMLQVPASSSGLLQSVASASGPVRTPRTASAGIAPMPSRPPPPPTSVSASATTSHRTSITSGSVSRPAATTASGMDGSTAGSVTASRLSSSSSLTGQSSQSASTSTSRSDESRHDFIGNDNGNTATTIGVADLPSRDNEGILRMLLANAQVQGHAQAQSHGGSYSVGVPPSPSLPSIFSLPPQLQPQLSHYSPNQFVPSASQPQAGAQEVGVNAVNAPSHAPSLADLLANTLSHSQIGGSSNGLDRNQQQQQQAHQQHSDDPAMIALAQVLLGNISQQATLSSLVAMSSATHGSWPIRQPQQHSGNTPWSTMAAINSLLGTGNHVPSAAPQQAQGWPARTSVPPQHHALVLNQLINRDDQRRMELLRLLSPLQQQQQQNGNHDLNQDLRMLRLMLAAAASAQGERSSQSTTAFRR